MSATQASDAARARSRGCRSPAAWRKLDVVQCGYCQSGQIMQAASLLATTPSPSDTDIDRQMGGNVCRCATYVRVRAAVHAAARTARGMQP